MLSIEKSEENTQKSYLISASERNYTKALLRKKESPSIYSLKGSGVDKSVIRCKSTSLFDNKSPPSNIEENKCIGPIPTSFNKFLKANSVCISPQRKESPNAFISNNVPISTGKEPTFIKNGPHLSQTPTVIVRKSIETSRSLAPSCHSSNGDLLNLGKKSSDNKRNNSPKVT